MGSPAYRGRTRSAPRANPEHKLQVSVKQYLDVALPPQIEWTSSLAGAHLGLSQRAKAKASGLRPGFPDLMFILPDGLAYFIEMKAPGTGRLSDDQKRVLSKIRPGHWAVCDSLEGVAQQLSAWGVKLRAHPFHQFASESPALEHR
jgi:hypothetical protein